MAAPLIAFAVLAAMQVISGNNQAAALRAQAKRKQMIADMNAEFAELDAWEAEQQGYADQARYQGVVDATVGTQRVAYASKNVDIGYGTAAEVQAETRITGMLNMLDIQKQARNKALGFKKEAQNLRLGGEMTRQQGDMDATATQNAAYMNAAGTALSGYDRNVASSPKAAAKATPNGPSTPWSTNYSDEFREGNLRADSDKYAGWWRE